MKTPPPQRDHDKARVVAPSLRPAAERPSRRRVIVGVALLIVGFAAIFFGGIGILGQSLLVGGSVAVLGSLFVLRPGVRLGLRHDGDTKDMRKLYGTKKA